MIKFDAEHAAVHYPPDRRHRLWIRPSILIGTAAVIAALVAAAWIEMAVAGLPHIPPVPRGVSQQLCGPAWLSAVGPLLPLLQLPLCHHAHPQRPFDPGRSSAPLLQRPLHTRAASGSDSRPSRFRASACGRPRTMPAISRRSSARPATGTPLALRACGTSSTSTALSSAACTSSPCSSPPSNGSAWCPPRPR